MCLNPIEGQASDPLAVWHRWTIIHPDLGWRVVNMLSFPDHKRDGKMISGRKEQAKKLSLIVDDDGDDDDDDDGDNDDDDDDGDDDDGDNDDDETGNGQILLKLC